MPARNLRHFLNENKVKWVCISHSAAYTAQEIAAAARIPGKELAKTVVVNLDGKMALAVLPASYMVDLGRLKDLAGARKIELSREQEFKEKFPECEVGAMPPFGNLYGMDIFAEEVLAEDEEIAFNAGSHKELIKLAYKDFDRLVKPKKGRFSYKSGVAAADQIKSIARRYIEDVWGKGDFEAERELVASDIVDHNPAPGQLRGLEGHHQVLMEVRAAFADTRVKAEDIIAEGDKVVNRWTMTATHKGEFMGIPATGKRITLTGMDMYRVSNGKIVETWHVEDMLSLMRQLGAIPEPAKPR